MAKTRILIADDHPILRDGTRKLLEREPDLEVVGEAADGEEAVRLATETSPDVIIMDVAMPKLNGIEATKQIKARLPSAAVLVLTSYDYDEYVFSLLEAGAAGYLLKSVKGDELVGAVRAVVNGEPVLYPAITRKLIDHLRTSSGATVEPRPPLAVTDREMEVLRLAAQGQGNKEIAEELHISVHTVQAHLRSIFNKLSVGSRAEAVVSGLKRGWFTLEDLP